MLEHFRYNRGIGKKEEETPQKNRAFPIMMMYLRELSLLTEEEDPPLKLIRSKEISVVKVGFDDVSKVQSGVEVETNAPVKNSRS